MTRFSSRTPELPRYQPPRSKVSSYRDDRASLFWEVEPNNEHPSWDVDIEVYATGDEQRGIAGRRLLALQLAPAIRAHSHGRNMTFRGKISGGLTKLWRFLDNLEMSGGSAVVSVADFDHAHGQLLKTYLLQDWKVGANKSRQEIGTIRYWLEQARSIIGMEDPELLWPSIQMERGTEHRDVDPKILRRLYHHLKRYHVGHIAAAEEGQRLLAKGRDPRTIGDGCDKAAWSSPANYAYLANGWVQAALRDRSISMNDFAGPRFANPKNFSGLTVSAPSYIPVEERTPSDAIRWFVPGVEDATAAFILFMLHTGWNPETVLNIDVTDLHRWADYRLRDTEDQQSKTATVAVYGYKGRAHKEQIAFSLQRPVGHPYQIIKKMIERTEPLREKIRRDIEVLENLDVRSKEDLRRLAIMKQRVKSPWLYFMLRNAGKDVSYRVGVLRHATNAILRDFCKKVASNSYNDNLSKENSAFGGSIETLKLSDIRDGFASFIYDNSLSNILLLKQALGHGNIRTTRAYLRQRRQIAQRFSQFTSFQESMFDEIAMFGQVDPTVLFVRARSGGITSEQRARLLDRRMRTRMGMGCLSPDSPPANIAPSHKGGVCAVQRCSLCEHGVVFADSLGSLAIRKAELEFIRSQVSSERFQGSTFQYEWIAVHTIVESLFRSRADEFDALAADHRSRLKEGDAYLFDQIPATFFDSGSL